MRARIAPNNGVGAHCVDVTSCLIQIVAGEQPALVNVNPGEVVVGGLACMKPVRQGEDGISALEQNVQVPLLPRNF